MPGAGQPSFEVLRFAAEPVSAEVALLELEGRFRAETRKRLAVPRLVAEDADGSREVAPAAPVEAVAEPDGALWRATYAVGIDELGGQRLPLAVGRQLLLGLPAPDTAAAQAATARCAWHARPTRCGGPPTRRARPPPPRWPRPGPSARPARWPRTSRRPAPGPRRPHARRVAGLERSSRRRAASMPRSSSGATASRQDRARRPRPGGRAGSRGARGPDRGRDLRCPPGPAGVRAPRPRGCAASSSASASASRRRRPPSGAGA